MVDRKLIPLLRGGFTIVDPEDFEWLAKYKWRNNEGYAATSIKTASGVYKVGLMHRLLLNAPRGVSVDHANGNRLDNRRSNIRFCTQAQNNRNQHSIRQQGKTSKFKGVGWNKDRQKWRARIGNTVISVFDSELEAAKAYDAAARFYYGEFAAPNLEGSEALSIQQIREAVRQKIESRITSMFTGVSWAKDRRRWSVFMRYRGKRLYIGSFESELEAAIAYDAKIRELGLPLSRLNFPDEQPLTVP